MESQPGPSDGASSFSKRVNSSLPVVGGLNFFFGLSESQEGTFFGTGNHHPPRLAMRVSCTVREAVPWGVKPIITSRLLSLVVAIMLALPAAVALAGDMGPATLRRHAFASGGVTSDGERNTATLLVGASGRNHSFASLRGGLDQPAGMVALLPGT